MNLNRKYDTIMGAWCEYASGPGWANSPVWVVVKDRRNEKHRIECLQPDEQNANIRFIFSICEQAHNRLIAEVEKCVYPKRKHK